MIQQSPLKQIPQEQRYIEPKHFLKDKQTNCFQSIKVKPHRARVIWEK